MIKTVFKGPVFSIQSGVVNEPGGARGRRDMVRHSGSVAILPVHEDGSVTLIRQYRCVFEDELVELPAGRIDAGETPLQAARRELREEVGLAARKWERLLRILPSPGFCDETVTIYRATGLTERTAAPDPDERIAVMTLALSDALRLLKNQTIEDAKTVVALLMETARRPQPKSFAPSRRRA